MAITFGTILMAMTSVIAVLAVWFSRYVLQGKTLFLCRLLILAGDAAGIVWLVRHGLRPGEPLSAAPVMLAIVLWFMFQLILSCLVLLAVICRFFYRHMMAAPVDMSRRRLLKKAAIYPIAAAGMSAYGGLYERSHVVERTFDVTVRGIDETGYRLAQISDVHLGLFFTVADLHDLLARAAASKPDMLVITGDLFDDIKQNDEAAAELDRWCAAFPDGIWFCLGNHEYYRGLPHIKDLLKKTQVHVLINRAEQVPGRSFWLAGVDYPFSRDKEAFRRQRASFMTKAFEYVPQDAPVILLAHHPEFIDDGAERRVPLVLTGHTHGSQFGFFGRPLFPVFKYTRGVVRIGETFGYVHSGNGSWFPFRFGCPPEIAYFRLKI